MADKNKFQTVIKKAWEDSWNWLLGTRIGAVVFTLAGGAAGGGIGVLLAGLIGGAIGAAVGIIVTVGLVFIIHMIITPSRLEKENRHKFIHDNANTYVRLFGTKQKRKYLKILELQLLMVEMENRVTDSKSGTMTASSEEIKQIQKKLSINTHIPTLPDSKALKLFLSGKASQKISETIKRLKLGIDGNMPTERQIEFFIKTRTILDETRFGLANSLPKQYFEYSKKIDDLIDEKEETPDWVILLQSFPAGFNSAHLWFSAQGEKRQNFFINAVKPSGDTLKAMTDFKNQRDGAIKVLAKYAEDTVKQMCEVEI